MKDKKYNIALTEKEIRAALVVILFIRDLNSYITLNISKEDLKMCEILAERFALKLPSIQRITTK